MAHVGEVARGELRVMTFNSWRMGTQLDNGLHKLCTHIKRVRPDLLCIQEVMKEKQFEELLELLGAEWDGVLPDDWDYIPSNAILAYKPRARLLKKFKTHLDAGQSRNSTTQGPIVGVRVLFVPAQLELEVFGVHLDWRGYGPELICFGDRSCGIYDVIKAESCPDEDADNCRVAQIRRLLEQARMVEALGHADRRPVLVCGDFNCPSHLDWTAETKGEHYDLQLEWPAPKLLEEAGMVDSYRVMHPDPLKQPGLTWSPVYKKHEKTGAPYPQDRIDFIFYKSNRLKPVRSEVYAGGANERCAFIPDHKQNDWPSDHAAVFTDFALLSADQLPDKPVVQIKYSGEAGMAGGRQSNYAPPPVQASTQAGQESLCRRGRNYVRDKCCMQ